MSTINLRNSIVEILTAYPETQVVFEKFNMRCAHDEHFANKTLEENIIEDRQSFSEILNELDCTIQAQSETHKMQNELSNSETDASAIDDIGEELARYTSIDEKFKWATLFWLLIPFLGIIIVLICVLVFFFKKHYEGVVGTTGFTIYRVSKKDKTLHSPKTYLFKEITGLTLSKTRTYTNGIYSGTSYKFKFWNKNAIVYSHSGSYRNEKDVEGRFGWRFSLLLKIEEAWTYYLLEELTHELNTKGFVRFDTEKEPVEIGIDYIKYKDLTFQKNELKTYYFNQGFLFIEHLNFEAKYMGIKTKGDKIKIPVNGMSNQRAFLSVINTLLFN